MTGANEHAVQDSSGDGGREDVREDVIEQLGRTNVLARKYRAGDPGSFPALFERITPALIAWVELRLRSDGSRRVDAQDVLQDVWLRALEGFDGYDSSRSFRAWILGIAKNTLLQCYARRTAAFSLSPSPDSGASTRAGEPKLLDQGTSIVTRLAKDDSFRAFMRFVDELDEEERALLLYCGIEGYSCAQAAARLQISSDTAGKRWQVLRARLRDNTAMKSLATAILE